MSLKLLATFESNSSNDDEKCNKIQTLISLECLNRNRIESSAQYALLISLSPCNMNNDNSGNSNNSNSKQLYEEDDQQKDNSIQSKILSNLGSNQKNVEAKIILIELKPIKFTNNNTEDLQLYDAILPYWLLDEFYSNNDINNHDSQSLYSIEIVPLYCNNLHSITSNLEKYQLYCTDNTEIILESLDTPALSINNFISIENFIRNYLSDKPIIIDSTFIISINQNKFRFKLKQIKNLSLDSIFYFKPPSSKGLNYKLTLENTISKKNENKQIEQVDLSTIIDLKKEIDSIERLLKIKKEISILGLSIKGILVSGAPGTQIRQLIKYISRDKHVIHLNSKSFSSSSFISSIIKEGDDSDDSKQIIYLFENIDTMGKRTNDNDTTNIGLIRLCNFIDEKLKKNHLLLASTSKISEVDSSLLRSGRFDKIISLPIPSQSNRLLILQSLLSNTPINYNNCNNNGNELKSSFFLELSRKTPGYVYQDLKKLCMTAVLNSISRQQLYSNESTDEVLPLAMKDFDDALFDVGGGSNLMHFDNEIPYVPWESVGGYQEIKQRFQELIEWPLLHSDTFQRLALTQGASSGVLLYGPSGCGKTLLVKAVATKMNVNFISIKGSDIFSKWLGESEKIIREIFERARLSSPCILFFDEIDSLCLARNNGDESGDGGSHNRMITQLLNEMDGIQVKSQLFLIGCTTKIDLLDPGLIRPGRLETQIYVGLPTKSDRYDILENVVKKRMAFDSDIDIDMLVEKSEGMTCAQLITLCNDAGINALKDDINSKTIKNKHFLSVVSD